MFQITLKMTCAGTNALGLHYIGRLGLRRPHVAGLALAVAALACIGHIAFQAYVTISGADGKFAKECGTPALLWSMIGFTRLDHGV